MRNDKAQMTFIAIIMVFMMLIVFSVFLPEINSVIDDATPDLDARSSTLLTLIPFFLVLGILLSVLTYSRPQYGG